MHIHVCGIAGIGVAKAADVEGDAQFTIVYKGTDGQELTVGEFTREQLRRNIEGMHLDLMKDADKEDET